MFREDDARTHGTSHSALEHRLRCSSFIVRLRLLRRLVVLHGANGVARRILEEDEMAHPADREAVEQDRPTQPLHRALLAILVDQLHQLPDAALWLPAPTTSGPARAASELIRDDPTLPLSAVALAVGISHRTLERAFLAATGVTLGAWRRRSRILGSLDYLASGVSVTETALTMGYTTPSAFVTAFKNELGQTPLHYLRPAMHDAQGRP